MHPKHLQYRVFKCLSNKIMYPKYSSRTYKGHTKTAWCYKCRAETRHIQISKGG